MFVDVGKSIEKWLTSTVAMGEINRGKLAKRSLTRRRLKPVEGRGKLPEVEEESVVGWDGMEGESIFILDSQWHSESLQATNHILLAGTLVFQYISEKNTCLNLFIVYIFLILNVDIDALIFFL